MQKVIFGQTLWYFLQQTEANRRLIYYFRFYLILPLKLIQKAPRRRDIRGPAQPHYNFLENVY